MKITTDILDKLSREARESCRLRMNYNLHSSPRDLVQQILNAIEPGANLPIARHLKTKETLFVFRGRLKIVIYNENKTILDEVTIACNTANIGYCIPEGIWHRVISLESGTICLEIKEGPYEPIKSEDIMEL